jgi:hypothetical protein
MIEFGLAHCGNGFAITAKAESLFASYFLKVHLHHSYK